MKKAKKAPQNQKVKALDAYTVNAENKEMRTDTSVPIQDDHNTLKAGSRGPSLLEDFIFRDKLQHFDRERIPERVVHARGTGAHGVFKLYKSMKKYTKAQFLNDTEIETPVFVRFSTVAGFRGSTDLPRDVRGFAVKFYTQEGNFDLVGNNIPVFFIQDAMKFPDLIHAVKPEADNEIPQAASAHDTFWDFISLMPEATHMLMWVMSDRGMPRSFRMMEGFGVHTFKFVNAKGEASFVKFHWKPVLGLHSVAWDEAQRISGKNSDFHRQDLYDAIANGDYAEWELGVQIVPEKDEFKFDFDLLDATKLIPEELVPVEIIGKMTLNKAPDNFFAEVEQAAFHPGNIVPGIDFSDDPLLQGRLFSYTDTQLHRLGSANFHQIPINRPLQQVYNNHRDGFMQMNVNQGKATYTPNTLGGGCPYMAAATQGGFTTYPEKIDAEKTRKRNRSFFDHFSQAKLFYNSQTPQEQTHIKDAISFELSKVNSVAIRQKMVHNLTNVDIEMAQYIAQKLGLPKPTKVYPYVNEAVPAGDNPKDYQSIIQDPNPAYSKALSIVKNQTDTIKTFQVAVLVADGFDEASYKKLNKELTAGGAYAKLVAPNLGTVTSTAGNSYTPDFPIFNTDAVLFDSVYVVGGKESVETLAKNADMVHFVNESYKHCKAVGLDKNTETFLNETYIAAAIKQKKNTDGLVVNGDIKQYIQNLSKFRFWERQQQRAVPA